MLLLLIKGKVGVIDDKIKRIKRHEGQTDGGWNKEDCQQYNCLVKGAHFPTFSISSALSAMTSTDFNVTYVLPLFPDSSFLSRITYFRNTTGFIYHRYHILRCPMNRHRSLYIMHNF